MRVRLAYLLSWHRIGLLLWIALACGGVTAFVVIASEVQEGDTRAIDERILLALRTPGDHSDPVGPWWLEELMRDITALGSAGVLGLMMAAAAGYLIIGRHFRTLALLVAAVFGGQVLSLILKEAFARPRPDLVPHGTEVASASFPSGHAMLSAVTYLTLAVLLARLQPRRVLKAYLFVVACALTVLVGVSRVYLGVHHPTDVLAGWSMGAGWAALCWMAANWLQRRGRVEAERTEAAAG